MGSDLRHFCCTVGVKRRCSASVSLLTRQRSAIEHQPFALSFSLCDLACWCGCERSTRQLCLLPFRPGLIDQFSVVYSFLPVVWRECYCCSSDTPRQMSAQQRLAGCRHHCRIEALHYCLCLCFGGLQADNHCAVEVLHYGLQLYSCGILNLWQALHSLHGHPLWEGPMLGQSGAFVLLVVLDLRSLPFVGIAVVDPAALSVAVEPATHVMLLCLFCTTQSSGKLCGGAHIRQTHLKSSTRLTMLVSPVSGFWVSCSECARRMQLVQPC